MTRVLSDRLPLKVDHESCRLRQATRTLHDATRRPHGDSEFARDVMTGECRALFLVASGALGFEGRVRDALGALDQDPLGAVEALLTRYAGKWSSPRRKRRA